MTCSSEPPLLAMSIAACVATAASSEPSVASRTLFGNSLISAPFYSEPTPRLRLVAQVLFAELAFQVALLPFDYPALDHHQRRRQKEDGPERVGEAGYSRVDHGHREITGVAGVPERPVRYQARHRLLRVDRRTGASQGPEEPVHKQHPADEERPSEDAPHPAWQEGDREPPVEQQPQNQRSRVDQGRRRNDPRLVPLVVCHEFLASSPKQTPTNYILPSASPPFRPLDGALKSG